MESQIISKALRASKPNSSKNILIPNVAEKNILILVEENKII
jgi:hypothetical protein